VNGWLVAPLLLTAMGVVGGALLPRVVSPATCARVLTAVALVAVAGFVSGVALVVLAGVTDHHAMVDMMGWCAALIPGDHAAASWVSAAAVLVLVLSAHRAWRYGARVRGDQHAFAHVRGVEVVAASGPVAFAVPGAAGGVVLGDELVRTLDPAERAAVLAHERAHLELGHHRYVRTSELCAAALPVLAPLARQVRFATERWADEAAATAVGSRRLVARTIARVALLGQPDTTSTLGLAFTGTGAADRVDALLHPSTTELAVPTAAAVVVLAVTLVGTSVQLHHLAAFVAHACLG
jgi:Zn-dependent protease with chaperone function